MKKLAALAGFCLGILGILGFASSASAQDEITFFNRKTQKEERITGTIEKETATEIDYKASTGRKDRVPSMDVIDVKYKVPGDLVLLYRKPFNDEDKALLPTTKEEERKQKIKEALQGYEELIPKLGEQKYAQQNLEYRVARLLARAAEDDASQVEPAIEKLGKFKADHPDSWQLIPCARLLAGLREQTGNAAAAQKIYEELAANEALPQEARQEFGLEEARFLIRGNQHGEALKKLKDLRGNLQADDPRLARIDVYIAACNAASGKSPDAEKQLKDMIAGKADNDAKAVACNALGDLHIRDGKAEDAFWDYLWVDVLYNQDREEHAKALYQLSKLFIQVKKDPTRADRCLERLITEKEFAGSPYQKLAAKDKQGATSNK
jgi:hypothetical protein